jgi:hypothetical protein
VLLPLDDVEVEGDANDVDESLQSMASFPAALSSMIGVDVNEKWDGSSL